MFREQLFVPYRNGAEGDVLNKEHPFPALRGVRTSSLAKTARSRPGLASGLWPARHNWLQLKARE